MIRELGYTPWIHYCPGLACRDIGGMPEHLDTLMRKVKIHAGDLNKPESKKVFRDCKSNVFLAPDGYAYAMRSLNLSYQACGFAEVDVTTGYLYMSMAFNGRRYKDIMVPVECIVDVFAKDNDHLSIAELAASILRGHLSHFDNEGNLSHTPYGKPFTQLVPASQPESKTFSQSPVQASLGFSGIEDQQFDGNVVSLASRRKDRK